MKAFRISRAQRVLTALFSLIALNGFAARVEVVSSREELKFFSGELQSVTVVFRNAGNETFDALVKMQLFQLSTATRMPAGAEQEWKKLTVLGGQTVMERATVKFPEVRAATRFEIRWTGGGEAIGRTVVTVYPTNILTQLTAIAGPEPFAVFDPHEQLTPLLRSLKIEFADLTEGQRVETWRGRLALFGPFDLERMQSSFSKRATELAANGVGVVLISTNFSPELPASVLLVESSHRGRLVTASPETVAGIATNAASQLALLRLARLAVNTNRLAAEAFEN